MHRLPDLGSLAKAPGCSLAPGHKLSVRDQGIDHGIDESVDPGVNPTVVRGGNRLWSRV